MLRIHIARLAPHQNAKTMAIFMAVISLVFFIPFYLLAAAFAPEGQRVPIWGIFVVPIVYLVFTYIGTIIGCAIYNVLVPITGGFEYESTDPVAR